MAAPTTQPIVSVVIPTFNEAKQLPATLASMEGNKAVFEVNVVDAQSSDDTGAIARERGANVMATDVRQRAFQMNAGARAARGQILLFLHADTRLAQGALDKMVYSLLDSTVIGGGFARRYDSPSPVLRLTCALAEARTRCFGWFLGDQAMFVRRFVFDDLGGFRPWDIFEDLDFSRRMVRAGRVVTLRPSVISAGRRFAARGALRTTWNDLRLTARYLSGRLPSPGEPERKSNPVDLAFTP